MAVEPEEVLHPFSVGSVKVLRAMRGANGDWSVEFELNFRVKVDEARDIHVTDRHVLVRGTQRGRKPIATHPGLASDEKRTGHTYSPRPGTEVCVICGFHKREHAPEHMPADETSAVHKAHDPTCGVFAGMACDCGWLDEHR